MLEIEPWYLLALATTTDQISLTVASFRTHFRIATMAFLTFDAENCFVFCSLQFDINCCSQVFFTKVFANIDFGFKFKNFGFFNILANMNIVLLYFVVAIRLKFDSNIFNIFAGHFHGAFQLFVFFTDIIGKICVARQSYIIVSFLNKLT